jgi:hypothetical protein
MNVLNKIKYMMLGRGDRFLSSLTFYRLNKVKKFLKKKVEFRKTQTGCGLFYDFMIFFLHKILIKNIYIYAYRKTSLLN